MGLSPCNIDITIEFDCQFKVRLKDGRLRTILLAFLELLPEFLTDFIQKVLLGLGEYVMALKKKPFSCECCGNDEEFIWKTRHGRETKILTIFQWLKLRQLQVQCKRCGHKISLTRRLLGIEPMKRIPEDTYRRLGLLGSLASFRVSEKIVRMFGWSLDKMTVWRSVQKTAREIEFKLDPGGLARGEADGTGIPINGAGKRGKELKVFLQYKRGGGVRVAGVDIGDYNSGWRRLFKGSMEVLRGFRSFLLVTDGDTSIFDGLKGRVRVLIQRCLWHIPYELKYTLWKDRVKRKSADWLHILSEVLEICAIRPMVGCEETIRAMISSKQKRLDEVIAFCRGKGLRHTGAYLENARGNMFTAIENRLHGRTTSRVERLFRTVNMRINVGKWSTSGGLNVTKVRLAYYYNGFDP